MNKELSALREYLLALKALVPDDAKFVIEHGKYLPFQNNPHIHELADVAKQISFEEMERIYLEIEPHMTVDQRSRAVWYFILGTQAENYLRTGKDFLTGTVTKLVPQMLADLDDIAEKLKAKIT